MNTSHIFDIMLKKVTYLGCPMATAYRLAENLSIYLHNNAGPDALNILPVAIDIPLNIADNARECTAFVRITDPQQNQEFLKICRGKYEFANRTVHMDVSTNPSKHHMDTRKQYAWSTLREGQSYRCSKQCLACYITRQKMDNNPAIEQQHAEQQNAEQQHALQPPILKRKKGRREDSTTRVITMSQDRITITVEHKKRKRAASESETLELGIDRAELESL